MAESKPSILILYDYFYPGYKAGGPIQSLTNLAVALSSHYSIFVITRSRDLQAKERYNDIILDDWNTITLIDSKNPIRVFYADTPIDKGSFLKLVHQAQPAVIYFNNIYSYFFFRLPLHTLKSISGSYKIVVCPRGMLQQGALAVKPFRKKIYLNYLRFVGLAGKVYWHATNAEEANDIKKHFPYNKGIVIAPNIPKPPFEKIFYPAKEQGQLKLVFLSLIAEKKNLLLLLRVILASQKNITLHIYGPVTDKSYWQQCQSLIHQMPEKVQYKGEVQPAQVQQLLSQYHALMLLTKGENFGHALYESLSVGRPIITSRFTPWTDLQQKSAGVNVDISNIEDCLNKLHHLTDLNQAEYNMYCNGAHQLALDYYNNLNEVERYRELFG